MNITVTATSKEISSNAGLIIPKKLMSKIYKPKLFADAAIPSLKSGASRSNNKLNQMILAFIAGAQCLFVSAIRIPLAST